MAALEAATRRLIKIEELSSRIGLSVQTIRNKLVREPQNLPCRIKMPGSNGLFWDTKDVDEWMDSLKRTVANDNIVVAMPANRVRRNAPAKGIGRKPKPAIIEF